MPIFKMCAAILALPAVATAQNSIAVQQVTGPGKDAGTYHVASGRWTRGTASLSLRVEFIYNNGGPISNLVAVPDAKLTAFTITDEGRIPASPITCSSSKRFQPTSPA